MSEISNIVRCKDCRFSVFVSHDPFTGNPRYHCGKGNATVDEFGDEWLVSDSGCEDGERGISMVENNLDKIYVTTTVRERADNLLDISHSFKCLNCLAELPIPMDDIDGWVLNVGKCPNCGFVFYKERQDD